MQNITNETYFHTHTHTHTHTHNSVTRIRSASKLADTLMPDTTEEITNQMMTPAVTANSGHQSPNNSIN